MTTTDCTPLAAVDRTWPLVTVDFAQRNPGRLHVIVTAHGEFDVYRGTKHLRRFTRHERAMTWAQSRAAIDKHPDATRYALDSPRKQGQDARTGAGGGPNYTHVISGPQNGSNEFDTFPEPMEAP